MVSPSGGLSATELAQRLSNFLERKVGPERAALSRRAVARLSDIGVTTLRDFLINPERRRASTVARISAALSSDALQVVRDNLRTVRVDAPFFTQASLKGLSRPDNPRGFQFIYQTDEYESGFGQTIFSDLYNENPEDMFDLVPGGIDNIVSVVWYKG